MFSSSTQIPHIDLVTRAMLFSVLRSSVSISTPLYRANEGWTFGLIQLLFLARRPCRRLRAPCAVIRGFSGCSWRSAPPGTRSARRASPRTPPRWAGARRLFRSPALPRYWQALLLWQRDGCEVVCKNGIFLKPVFPTYQLLFSARDSSISARYTAA